MNYMKYPKNRATIKVVPNLQGIAFLSMMKWLRKMLLFMGIRPPNSLSSFHLAIAALPLQWSSIKE